MSTQNNTSSDPPTPLAELQQSASNDLSQLGRVSHRLAMTDDGVQLEKVLTLLLPRLLSRIGSNHGRTVDLTKVASEASEASAAGSQTGSSSGTEIQPLKQTYDKIHARLVEMLSHAMKRVRADRKCRVPCRAVLGLLYDTDDKTPNDPKSLDAFTVNLSLAFLTLGLSRCTTDEVEELLPGLISLLAAHTGIESVTSVARKSQHNQIAHLILRSIEAIVNGNRRAGTAGSASGRSGSSSSSSSSAGGDGVSSRSTGTANASPSKSLSGQKTELAGKSRPSDVRNGYLRDAREAASSDGGAAIYDLLLDVLLYQPTAGSSSSSTSSSIPPPGLSQAGHERLLAGTSTTAAKWGAEFAAQARLRDLKLSVLEFIAPCRRWALFQGEVGNTGTAACNADGDDDGVGTARTVALLAVASGDAHQDVAERARDYLKAHMDSLRNVVSRRESSSNATQESATNGSLPLVEDDDQEGNTNSSDTTVMLHPLLGDPVRLSTALLSLVLGDSVAESIVVKATPGASSRSSGLSMGALNLDGSSPDNVRVAVMSTKRRMVSEKAAATLLTFVSARILDDVPRIFAYPYAADNSSSDEQSVVRSASVISALALASASYCLGSALGSGNAGSSVGGQALRARLSAAKLLNSLSVRLVVLYDALSNLHSETTMHDEVLDSKSIVHDLLARAFALACDVLSASASGNTSVAGNQQGVETKDSCYGIVCTIARSAVATCSSGMVFNIGEATRAADTSSSGGKGAVSIKTASLLFGCASYEEEILRPRAAAALDAVLAAYCRVYTSDYEHNSQVKGMDADMPANPWAQPSTSDTRSMAQSQSSTTNFDALARSLLPLLWSSAKSTQPKASRLAAARWANDLVKPIHLSSACHILCFLAGDADVTASAVAREGLGLALLGTNQDITTLAPEVEDGEELPDFRELVNPVFADTTGTSTIRVYRDFSPRAQGATLRFGLMCLLADLYGGEDEAVATYMDAISSSLSDLDAVSSARGTGRGREALDLLDCCCFCLAGVLGTSSYARLAFVKSASVNHQYISSLAITAASSKARRLLAECCGYLYEDKNIWASESEGIISTENSCATRNWAKASGIAGALSLCASKLKEMRQTLFMAGEVHGAAHLGSRCVRAFRLHAVGAKAAADDDCPQCWTASAGIISALGHGTLHSDDAIGNACSQGLAVAFSYDQVDAPELDQRLYEGTSKAFEDLAIALTKYGNGDNTDPQRASLLAKAAGSMLAASTSSSGVTKNMSDKEISPSLGNLRLQCVDSIFSLLGSMSCRKDPEISLVAGEALVQYADAYSPEGAEWSSPSITEPDDFDESFAVNLPPHRHVLYVLLNSIVVATNPHKRTSSAPAMLALVAHAAAMVNKNSIYASRHFVAEMLNSLVDFQTAFVKLLADPKNKQLGRESCCLGLAACHGLASATAFSNNQASRLNERLLNAFGSTTNDGGSAMQETDAENRERLRQENRDGDAGVGAAAAMMEDFGMEADAMAEAGGVAGMSEAALASYREMAAAAMALGRPDILYSLMLLSTSHPIWSTPAFRYRYNASALLGEAAGDTGRNIQEIQSALRPHLGKLIPRLLRACNDPRKETREQMTALWVGLTGGGAESRAAITEHLLTTVDALINDATNKLWRARVGACGALADVIVGRSWTELGGGGAAMDDEDAIAPHGSGSMATAAVRLLRLLRVTTRSLDDVRLTVRESGETLGRSVRALTIRLCDPSSNMSKDDIFQSGEASRAVQYESDARAAASTALRWLVIHGLNQPSAEATGFCLSTLLGVIDVAKHSTLQPVLPDLVYALLMAMSGLEPAALNYLQTRAAGRDSDGAPGASGYDRLERLRLQMAQSGPIAGALTKCLGLIRLVDVDAQKKIIPHLDAALRQGAGFATRAAVADAVTSLCSTSPSAFKIVGHSSTNPTVRLLRALYFASEREKGAGARDKMAHALGSLAELAPGHSVRVLALRACERYSASVGGTNNDPAARRAAAAALRSIAVRASTQFGDGGSNDVWCKRVLPLAFLGRKDDDKKVASLWNEVWDEGGTVANTGGAAQDFGVLLEEKLLPSLVRTCMDALYDVSWSRRVTACEALIELADMNVLSPAPRSTKDEIKSVSARSLHRERRRAQGSAEVLATCTRLIAKSRLWAGKNVLVKATAKVASKWAILGVIEDDVANLNIFGSEKAGQCEWMPIRKEIEDWNSLFVDDKWFKDSSSSSSSLLEEDKSIGVEANSFDKSDVKNGRGNEEEESDLDFKDEDTIFGSEKLMVSSSDLPDADGDKPTNYGILTVSGLCRLLLEQGLPSTKAAAIDNEILLPYRSETLQALSDLLNSLRTVPSSSNKVQLASAHDIYLYSMIAPKLISEVRIKTLSGSNDATPKKSAQPPLIIARCLGCLSAATWKGIGERDEGNEEENVASLSKIYLELCGGKQPAWTVREAAAHAACSLAEKAAPSRICKHVTITTLLECTIQTQKDRKFWRVRMAGLKLLHALVNRAGSFSDASGLAVASGSDAADRQLILEAILPEKERIQKIARTSLTDNEAQVTAVATEICGALSWWP